MYISRIRLDETKEKTQAALVNPSVFHGIIENCFPGERRASPLWRIDRLHGRLCLLMVSREIPDLTAARRQIGTEEPAEIKDYSRALESLQNGGVWNFRLVVHAQVAYHMEVDKDPVTGLCPRQPRRESVRGREDLLAWLEKRAPQNGFDLCSRDSVYVSEKKQKFWIHKGTSRQDINQATIEGTLRITDTEKFTHLLTHGIGRHKTYGNGLLTIVPAAA